MAQHVKTIKDLCRSDCTGAKAHQEHGTSRIAQKRSQCLENNSPKWKETKFICLRESIRWIDQYHFWTERKWGSGNKTLDIPAGKKLASCCVHRRMLGSHHQNKGFLVPWEKNYNFHRPQVGCWWYEVCRLSYGFWGTLQEVVGNFKAKGCVNIGSAITWISCCPTLSVSWCQWDEKMYKGRLCQETWTQSRLRRTWAPWYWKSTTYITDGVAFL